MQIRISGARRGLGPHSNKLPGEDDAAGPCALSSRLCDIPTTGKRGPKAQVSPPTAAWLPGKKHLPGHSGVLGMTSCMVSP